MPVGRLCHRHVAVRVLQRRGCAIDKGGSTVQPILVNRFVVHEDRPLQRQLCYQWGSTVDVGYHRYVLVAPAPPIALQVAPAPPIALQQ